MTNRFVRAFRGVVALVTACVAVGVASEARADAVAFDGATAYTQNFQSLTGTTSGSAIGTFNVGQMTELSGMTGWGSSASVAGWYLYTPGSSGTKNYFTNTGSLNSGGAYQMVDSASPTGRALGSLASGSYTGFVGVVLKNTSGATIDRVTISYDAVMNRNPATTANALSLSYRVSSTDVVASGVSAGEGTFATAAGTWTSSSALSASTPSTGTGAPGTQGAITPLFKVATKTATLTGLNWAPNAFLYIRWADIAESGANATFGVDNFSITGVLSAAAGSSPSGDGWTISASTANTAQAGSFTGSSADNGGTPPSGAGAGSTAWGLYANSGQSVTATLAISPVLGQTVAIDFDNGQIDNGSSVGVELRSTSGAAVTFGFTGGDSVYKVTDASGTTSTSVGYTDAGQRVSFTIGQGGGYRIATGSYSKTGLFAGGATSIASIRVFNTNAGSGSNKNVYFNNLAISAVASIDLDGDGYNAGSGAGLDCNDNNSAIKPGAAELCSNIGVDNNCDGSTSDIDASASDLVTFYTDADGDTYTLSTGALFCSGTTNAGYRASVSSPLDCNDGSASIYPSAPELCATTGTDNNCDGSSSDVDANASDRVTFYADADGDTYTLSTGALFCSGTTNAGYRSTVSSPLDCNDSNASVNPGATETCNTIDDDCDGSTDEGVTTTYYADGDGDGFGRASTTQQACTAPSGYVAVDSDCNDGNAAINPGATDLCDGVDNNCDGAIDPSGCTSQTLGGNGKSGFGGPIGGSSLQVARDGGDWVFTLTKGAGDFNDALVLYFDTEVGGFTSTAGFTDTGDYLRKAISGFDGTNRSTVNFPSGFTADHVIALTPSANAQFGGGWKLVSGGSHEFRASVGLTPGNSTTSATYTFRIARSQFGISSGGTFKMVGTYLNGGNAFRSNEGYGEGLPASNVGQASCTFTTFVSLIVPCTDVDGDGVCSDTDCDDNNAAKYPGATEICDGLDNDCDASIDEGLAQYTYYRDFDLDTYGSATATTTTCATSAPSGYVTNGTDCDDARATANPAASELCNGLDDDCDSIADEGLVFSNYYTDGDGDGFGASGASPVNSCAAVAGSVTNNSDCNDGNAAIKPGATEVCNSIDDDCDGATDEGLVFSNYYTDGDGDGYGASGASPVNSCAAVAGSVTNNSDCNDADAAIKPGATEICDTKDNDCDGSVDEGVTITFYPDADGDTYGAATGTVQACSAPSGFVAIDSDCDDTNAAAYPGAPELCANSTVDNDCDLNAVEIDFNAADKVSFYRDQDDDGISSSTTALFCPGTTNAGYLATLSSPVDCNDSNSLIGLPTTFYADVDGDEYGSATSTQSVCAQVSAQWTIPTAIAAGTTGASYTYGAADQGALTAGSSLSSVHAAVATAYTTVSGNGSQFAFSSNNWSIGDYYQVQFSTIGMQGVALNWDQVRSATGPATFTVIYSTDGGNSWSTAFESYSVGTTSWNTTTASTSSTFSAVLGAAANNKSSVIVRFQSSVTVAAGGTSRIDNITVNATAVPTGYLAIDSDCDDGSASVHPGAAELCSNLAIDNDCDGITAESEATDRTTYYADSDGDGYGVAGSTTLACSLPGGYAVASGDCNDASSTVNPGRTELCNGIDDDCAGGIDNGLAFANYYTDGDSDGYGSSTASAVSACAPVAGSVTNNGDCNDGNGAVNPGATEVCNGIDDDCDSATDEGVTIAFYRDSDGDGFGNSAVSQQACAAPTGFVANSTDCNDDSAAINPNAAEVCDSANTDENCNGFADNADSGATGRTDWYADTDGDGYGAGTATSACDAVGNQVSSSNDCAPSNGAINPGAQEICDAGDTDEDCDGFADDADSSATGQTNWYADTDGDGFGAGTATSACNAPAGSVSNATDGCPDNAALTSPATYYRDADGDTYTTAATTTACALPTGYAASASATADCDDTNALVNPSATESCNGIDDDCVGGVDNGLTFVDYYVDADGDTYGTGEPTSSCSVIAGRATRGGDCDDGRASANPAASETCNGLDDDCVGGVDNGLTFVTYYGDSDMDGAGDPAVMQSACAQPAGYVTNSNDGCPSNGALTSPATYYRDADGDTYGNASVTESTCASTPSTGYVANNTDCDDSRASANPAAAETCNGLDDDCDLQVDDGLTFVTYYGDSDMDGAGDPAVTQSACSQPAGYVANSNDGCPSNGSLTSPATYYRDADSDTYGNAAVTESTCSSTPSTGYVSNNTDCDDSRASANPAASETCNGLDDDCVGGIDNGLTFVDYYVDADGDTYGTGEPTSSCSVIAGRATRGGDCDDGRASANPAAAETCNGLDDDCDLQVDDGLTFVTYYGDSDMDGAGDPGVTQSACAQPAGYVTNSNDGCPSNGALTSPATYYRDADSDTYGNAAVTESTCSSTPSTGYVSNNTDCDDGRASANPAASETCNGLDDDCDLQVDDGLTFVTYYGDSDMDGAGDPAVSQSACAQPAGYVTNSNDGCPSNGALTSPATYYRDADSDSYGNASVTESTCSSTPSTGYVANSGDCDDSRASANPAASETCNGLDDDCDLQVDDGLTFVTYYGDSDMDGAGDPAVMQSACAQPAGYVTNSNDGCPSNGALTSPATYYRDADSDTYGNASVTESTCSSTPSAGYVSNNTDCDDSRASANPAASETCNGLDDDCVGGIDNGLTFVDYYVDADGDTYGTGEATSSCSVIAGRATRGGDCDDGRASANPAASETCNGLDDDCDLQVDDGLTFVTYYGDSDMDGAGDPAVSQSACAQPAGYVANSNDGCPSNGALTSPATYYRDADSDTYGNASVTESTCSSTPSTGYVSNNTDCDDSRASANPAASETCNGLDDDCDLQVDDGLTFVTYYGDSDMDGAGDPAVSQSACAQPAGYVTNSNDGCPSNGALTSPATYYRDADSDTYGNASVTESTCSSTPSTGYVSNNTDCDDGRASANPAAAETCNGLDDDCDLQVDDGLTFVTYYGDSDMDGAGDPAVTQSACAQPAGYVTNSNDGCPSNGALTSPATYYRDADSDTYGNAAVTESTCSSTPSTGYVSNNTDCDDSRASANPAAAETCNGLDDDCVGGIDNGLTFVDYYVDADGDTYGTGEPTSSCSVIAGRATRGGDCDDGRASANPAASETCNGLDDDCVGGIDNGLTFVTYYGDSDMDGAGDPAVTQSACAQPAGYVTNSNDGCPSNGSLTSPATYYRDADSDSYGNAAGTESTCSSTPSTGYVSNNTDCDDSRASANPAASETCNGLDDDCVGGIDNGLTFVDYYVDADGDTYGTGEPTSSCSVIAGRATRGGDCDDGRASANPAAAETCNGLDDDCVGGVDNGLTFVTYYGDSDMDGAGDPAVMQSACAQPAGYVTNSNDGCPSNGSLTSPATYYRDADGDTYGNASVTESTCSSTPSTGYVANSGDCDDDRASANPAASETCNGLDDDCDLQVDDGLTFVTYYGDSDMDGAGDPAVTRSACAQPAGYVANSNDGCPSNGALTSPATYYRDADGDGFTGSTTGQFCDMPSGYEAANDGDCNDSNAAVNPGATETCNGVDDDCVGGIDNGLTFSNYYTDGDGDGFGSSTATAVSSCSAVAGSVTNNGDCDDGRADVSPADPEVCDGANTDEDCDGSADDLDAQGATGKSTFHRDADGDGYTGSTTGQFCDLPAGYEAANDGDCNDGNGAINPGATEVCDAANTDENCNGVADNADSGASAASKSTFYRDADGDGYTGSTTGQFCDAPAGYEAANDGDCDDGRATAYPGAPELCNSLDDNCNSTVDENVGTFRYYRDDDGDGFGDPLVSLANCTGVTPDGFVSNNGDCDDTAVLYADADGDGVGSGPFAGCGVSTNTDNCPTTSNADQANCDSDAQGNACDADDDNDLSADANDPWDCDATRSIANASLTPAEITAFLAGASGVTVDATGMTPAQLAAVADGASAIAANGVTGAFTITSALSSGQISAILDRVQVGSSFTGGATVTIDATGMSPTQLSAVAADIAAVTTVENVTLTSASGAGDIAALVSKAPAGEATIVATGMGPAQLAAGVSGATAVTVTGSVVIDSGLTPAQIAEITGSLASTGTSVQFDTTGMTPAQQQAVTDAIADITADNGGTNPYCDTTDADGDGYFADACYENLDDCNDASNLVRPGAVENCANIAVDNDCDGDTGAAEAVDSADYYTDGDTDGFGAGSAAKACAVPAGMVADNTDCDDTRAAVYPGAPELCANLAVDNDCDGSTAESEATDRSTYYADTDGDAAGDAGSTVLACTQPVGFVAVAGDACPSNPALTAPITYYADTDGDGAGDGAAPSSFCQTTAPAGFASGATDGCPADPLKVAPGTCGCGVTDGDADGDGTVNCLDGCPNDPLKVAPGACGCGVVDADADGDGTANCNDGCPNDPLKVAAGACGCGYPDTDYNANSVADCLETSPVISFAADATGYSAGESIILRASTTAPSAAMAGVQVTLHFDPTRLLFVSATPVAGQPFSTEIAEIVDNTLGTLRYAISIDPNSGSPGLATGGPLLDLAFVLLPSPTACASNAYLSFAPVGTATTGFTGMDGSRVDAIPGLVPTLRLDSAGPVLDGMIAATTVPTDAGSSYGGFVAAPTVTATDDCDGARAVSLSIALAGGATASSWPADGLFPIGTSTVTWSSSDALGNLSTVSRTVTVENHQLLDAAIAFQGAVAGTSSRQVRITVGAQTTLHTVAMTGSSGAVTGLQVPVAAGYACMRAKDPVHAISDASAPAVVARRYAAAFTMKQGDSNDDDLVDIFDFALFLSNRGGGKATNAVSNFNGDTVVNNADFAYVSLNFLQAGESCASGLDGDAPQPRTRVSIKELRRSGLGDLAVADINRDGWLDTRDMQLYLQGGSAGGSAAVPEAAAAAPGW